MTFLCNFAVSDEAAFLMFNFKKWRNVTMKEFWNGLQLILAGAGGWLGYFLGGYDGILYALIIFIINWIKFTIFTFIWVFY